MDLRDLSDSFPPTSIKERRKNKRVDNHLKYLEKYRHSQEKMAMKCSGNIGEFFGETGPLTSTAPCDGGGPVILNETVYGYDNMANPVLRCVFYNRDASSSLINATPRISTFSQGLMTEIDDDLNQRFQMQHATRDNPSIPRDTPDDAQGAMDIEKPPLLKRQSSFDALLKKFSYEHYVSRPPTKETGAIPKQLASNTTDEAKEKTKSQTHYSIVVYGDVQCDKHMQQLFCGFGKIVDIRMQPDRNRAWITFFREDSARRAVDEIEALNYVKGTEFKVELVTEVPPFFATPYAELGLSSNGCGLIGSSGIGVSGGAASGGSVGCAVGFGWSSMNCKSVEATKASSEYEEYSYDELDA